MTSEIKTLPAQPGPTCVDCGTPMPGALGVASEGGAGVAWCCQACGSQYPNPVALRDRLSFVAMLNRGL